MNQISFSSEEFETVRWAVKDRYMACLRKIEKCRLESEELVQLYEEEADRCKAVLEKLR